MLYEGLPNPASCRGVGLRVVASVLLAIVCAAWNHPAVAQSAAQSATQSAVQPAPSQPVRKIKTSVQPRYPDLARQNNVYGSARLQVRIAKDGSIKDIKVLGGSPLLVQASVDAVRRWKYVAAATESTVVLKFDFKP